MGVCLLKCNHDRQKARYVVDKKITGIKTISMSSIQQCSFIAVTLTARQLVALFFSSASLWRSGRVLALQDVLAGAPVLLRILLHHLANVLSLLGVPGPRHALAKWTNCCVAFFLRFTHFELYNKVLLCLVRL